MHEINNMIRAQIMMFLYLGVGGLCRKLGYTDSRVEDKLTAAVINIVMPCMIFHAILNTLADLVLSEVIIVAGLCVVVVLLSYGVGWIIYRKESREQRPVLIFSVMSSNSAFIGLPVIAAVYGDQGIFYAAIYMTVARSFSWTLGLNLFIKGSKGHVFRRIVTNPNNLAVIVAAVVFYLRIPIWAPLFAAIEEIGGTSTLLCMVMVGSLVAGSIQWKKLLCMKAYGYSALRLLLIPMVTLILLRFMHIHPVIVGSIVILVSAPAPTLACIMAARHGADKEFAAILVLLSTLLSFLTQPLMAFLCLI